MWKNETVSSYRIKLRYKDIAIMSPTNLYWYHFNKASIAVYFQSIFKVKIFIKSWYKYSDLHIFSLKISKLPTREMSPHYQWHDKDTNYLLDTCHHFFTIHEDVKRILDEQKYYANDTQIYTCIMFHIFYTASSIIHAHKYKQMIRFKNI